jgi:hypothetical protein
MMVDLHLTVQVLVVVVAEQERQVIEVELHQKHQQLLMMQMVVLDLL